MNRHLKRDEPMEWERVTKADLWLTVIIFTGTCFVVAKLMGLY